MFYFSVDPESIDAEKKITKKKRKRMENRNCCLRCLCCACLPKWATFICWFIIIAIIIVIIVIGAIMSKFQLPTIEIQGVTNSTSYGVPPLQFAGDTFKLNFGLNVKAINPNLLPIYITDMNATVNMSIYKYLYINIIYCIYYFVSLIIDIFYFLFLCF